ncbi:MAG: NfeD family protein [Dehalococcoidia bacterium]|jgi:membrane-bound serine protease (ClpP class)
MMTTRLIIAIITTALEEAAIAAIGIWLLPKVDIHIPLFAVILIMFAWLAFAVFSYQMGTRALMRKPHVGLSDMVGSRGEVVKPLDPEGMVRIKGETWKAKAAGRKIESGVVVVVVGQKGLKLIVERDRPSSRP